MRLVRFTTLDNNDIAINPEKVASVQRTDPSRYTRIGFAPGYFEVDEPIEKVIEKLETKPLAIDINDIDPNPNGSGFIHQSLHGYDVPLPGHDHPPGIQKKCCAGCYEKGKKCPKCGVQW